MGRLGPWVRRSNVQSYADVDWDTFWRWEILMRQGDPVDYMRWKADSSRGLRALPEGRDRDGEAPLILDATCGMGYHAMVQRRLGFRVEACDGNERVLRFAEALFRSEGLDIPTLHTPWEALGERVPERYDLIFNDEVHQVFPKASMIAVLSGIYGALRPGGCFVYFFADSQKPDNGPGHAQWDWRQHGQKVRRAWSCRAEGVEVTLDIQPERVSDTMIFEHHRYSIRKEDGTEATESMIMPRNYHWDWNHMTPLLSKAGFGRVESHEFTNVHGNSFTMNLAIRERDGDT